MDVDSITTRILSRSGFYEEGMMGEHFWTEMQHYRTYQERGLCSRVEEFGKEATETRMGSNSFTEDNSDEEFFECWDYWHRLGSL